MVEDLVPTINLLLGSSYWWSLCHQAGWLPCMARTTSGELGKLKSNQKEQGVSNQYFLATLRKDNENDFSSLVVVRTKIKEHLYKPNLQEILCKEFSHFAFLVIQNRQFHFLACSYNLHFSQKHHCNDNCNDFSDYKDIIAPPE